VHRPVGLPRWTYLPAALGMVFVVLPLVAMAVKVDWPHFGSLITSPSSRTALLLSLQTATASTALCLVLGVPMALVLARSGLRLVRWLRPLILLPLVLPPVVGGIALLYAFGRLGRRYPYRLQHDRRGAGADVRLAAVPGHRLRGRGPQRGR
jgi:molybdate transport system permease protein